MPVSVNCFSRGITPAGVICPPAATSVTLSPTRTPSARASSAPSTMFQLPGVSAASVLSRSCAASGVTVASSAGEMPRTMAARMSSPRATSACAATKGAAPSTWGLRARLGGGGLPVGQRRAARLEHLDMRDHRQHAVAHLLLEAVHHAEHDDQRGHAQRDAEHRHAGDEGDEAVAPPAATGPRVAPADLQFIGEAHVAGMLTDACAAAGPPRTPWRRGSCRAAT